MTSKFSLSKNREEEEEFIKEVTYVFKMLNTTNLLNKLSIY